MPETLPHEPEIEEALVARLLVDPSQLPLVASSLNPDDLYVPAYRKAYAEMVRLSREGKAIDIAALGAADLDVTRLTIAHRAPVTEYVESIQRAAWRRRLIGNLDRVLAKAYTTDNREQLLADLRDASQAALQGISDDGLKRPDQAVEQYLASLERRRHGKGRGLPYGIFPLDQILQPAQGGDMIVIAARPSVGKTAVAEIVADNWASDPNAEGPVLFCSLEMSVPKLLRRSIARSTAIGATRLSHGDMGDADYDEAAEAARGRRAVNVWYLDNASVTTATVRATAAKVRILADGLRGIVVDYIQLLADKGDAETQRVTQISRQIKAIAREFDVPVLALSQLNRAVMQGEDKHPQLHHLRESGAIEQDADVVIGLYRPLNTPNMDLTVLKNRDGKLGSATLYYDDESLGFRKTNIDTLVRDALDF